MISSPISSAIGYTRREATGPMKYSVCGKFVCSTLVALLAACGGQKSDGGNTGTTKEDKPDAAAHSGALTDAAPSDTGAGANAPTQSDDDDDDDDDEADASVVSVEAGPMPSTPSTEVPLPFPPVTPTTEPTMGMTTPPDMTAPPVSSTAEPMMDPEPSIGWSSLLQAPEDCQIETAFGSSADRCLLNLVCDGNYVVRSDCYPVSETGFQCYCQNDIDGWNVAVEGGQLVDTCQASIDFCQDPSADELGTLECEASNGAADSSSCYASKGCSRVEEFDSGVTATIENIESAECYIDPGTVAGQNGEWQCTCVRGGGSYATLFVPGLEPKLDTCTQAQQLCLKFDTMVPGTGTLCEVATESFNETSCSSVASCLVAGTIDGVLVHVTDDLIIDCHTAGESELECTVDGPLGISTVTFARTSPTLDACRQAAADMLEQIDSQNQPDDPEPNDAGVVSVVDGGAL